MKYVWESFLGKLREDGGDLAGSHPPSLLKAFYAYLVEEHFLGTPEDIEVLRRALKSRGDALKSGKVMYQEVRKSLHRVRRFSRLALDLLKFMDQADGPWWSENPDKRSPHDVCVSRSTIDKLVEVRKYLDEAARYNNGDEVQCKKR